MTLARLIEAVEAGLATGGPADALAVPKEQSDLIASVLGDDDELWNDFVEAHDGSIDAAERLRAALLPKYWFQLSQWPMPEMALARVGGAEGRDKLPSRAFLIAILRAMEGRDG